MKQNIGLFVLFITLIWQTSCGPYHHLDNKEFENIYLFQNGKEKKLHNGSTITIPKKEFSLHFYNKVYDGLNRKFYTVQIAAFLDKKYQENIQEGMRLANIPFFAPGTGLAAERDGYKSLTIDNKGHHYLYYTNAHDKRLNLLSKHNEYYKLAFPINKITIENRDYKINDLPIDKIYISILIDRNLNKAVDKNELYNITIIFK